MKKEKDLYVKGLLSDTADRLSNDINVLDHKVDVIEQSLCIIDSCSELSDEQRFVVLSVLQDQIDFLNNCIDDLMLRINFLDDFCSEMVDDDKCVNVL